MRALFAIFLVATLAGCSDAPTPEIEVHATTETGVIRGIALDTTITPVAGANITIEGYAVTAQTNADGAFGFDGLEPGRYLLRANHPDYFGAQAQVDVVANVDDPEFIQITMQPEQVVVPFAQPFQWEGFLQCSYRMIQFGDNCPNGNAETTHEVPNVPEWVQSELTWESTQLLGDELSFQYSYPNTNSDYLEMEGPSPLNLIGDGAIIDKEGIGDGLDLYLRVFSADLQATRPPTGHWGVGVQIDQRFTSITHVFYGFQPEPGWTFTTDGSP